MLIDPVEEVVGELQKECLEDHVGLWQLPWHFREIHGINDEQLRRERSFEVMEHLLASPNVRLLLNGGHNSENQ